MPQTLVNVTGVDTSLFGEAEAIAMAVEQERAAMGRPAGCWCARRTEPVVRVMVECTEPGVAEATASRLHALIEHELLAAAVTREAEALAAAETATLGLDAGV